MITNQIWLIEKKIEETKKKLEEAQFTLDKVLGVADPDREDLIMPYRCKVENYQADLFNLTETLKILNAWQIVRFGIDLDRLENNLELAIDFENTSFMPVSEDEKFIIIDGVRAGRHF